MDIAIGLNSLYMRPVSCVFDTGSAPSLLRDDMVEPNSMSSISVSKKPLLRSVTNQKVEFVGKIILQVRMGETSLHVMFGIVKNLEVQVLLRASFIVNFVKVIFLEKREIVSFNSQLVPMLLLHKASANNRTTTRTTNVADCRV